MIVKNLTRKSSIQQLFSYVFEKERESVHDGFKPIVIKHNVRSHSVKNWVKEFEKNEQHRINKRVDNIKLNHAILSFSSKDREYINEKVLRDIANKFIELRGRNNMYVIKAHTDVEHPHVHILYSAVEYQTGLSNNLSRSAFSELKKSLDNYQRLKYSELEHSFPQHGKQSRQKLSREEYLQQLRQSHQSQKLSLIETLEKVFSEPSSIKDLETSLKAEGHELYYRNEILQGIKFEGGRKFRFSRLGDYQEKLTELSKVQTTEKRALDSIQAIRQNHSSVRTIQSGRQNQASSHSWKTRSNDVER